VLDVATVWSGRSHHEALVASVDLAREVERLGYRRFWLAEHHNMEGIASSAPAVLVAAVAAVTERIRVGSGGVMLTNHAPLVVAEQFGTLEALHPGRIDLGLGRAPGTDLLTASALGRGAPGPAGDDFPRLLGELLAFFAGSFPEDHPYRAITAVPGAGDVPAVWLLGSSGYSAQVAGLLGLPFSFAHHFSPEHTVPALALYRERFTPSDTLAEPHSMIAVQVLCADDDERARELAAPQGLAFARRALGTGRLGPMPTPAETAAHAWTDQERALVAGRQAAQAVGGPETVGRVLDELLERTGADELMVTTSTYDPADRLRSMELVQSLFDEPDDPGATDSGPA
jgi:luciferase family oxidoreductase group 1